MLNTEDLKTRVETRRQELIKKLRMLKDNTEDEADAKRDAIKKRLSELGHVVKESVTDSWEDLGDVARARLARWLEA